MEKQLTVHKNATIATYGSEQEFDMMVDRLLGMHPAAGEVGVEGMRAAAQLAIAIDASPLPSTNEIHVWKDKGTTRFSLGVNYYRRKAGEWGGVLWQDKPRQMNDRERKDYGVPDGMIGAICRAVKADDMKEWVKNGFTVNEVWDMCGATGVATVYSKEYAKNGRPLVWTALKRAEIDLYRQLFPVLLSGIQQKQSEVGSIVIEADEVDDYNEYFFGDEQRVTSTAPAAKPPEFVEGEYTERMSAGAKNGARDPMTAEQWEAQALKARTIDHFSSAVYQALRDYPGFNSANEVKQAVKLLREGKPTDAPAMLDALKLYASARADDVAHEDAHESALKKYRALTGADDTPEDEVTQGELFDDYDTPEPVTGGAYSD